MLAIKVEERGGGEGMNAIRLVVLLILRGRARELGCAGARAAVADVLRARKRGKVHFLLLSSIRNAHV